MGSTRRSSRARKKVSSFYDDDAERLRREAEEAQERRAARRRSQRSIVSDSDNGDEEESEQHEAEEVDENTASQDEDEEQEESGAENVDEASMSSSDEVDDDDEKDEDYTAAPTAAEKKRQLAKARESKKKTQQPAAKGETASRANRAKRQGASGMAIRAAGPKQIQRALANVAQKVLVTAKSPKRRASVHDDASAAVSAHPDGSTIASGATRKKPTESEVPTNSLFAALLHSAQRIPNYPRNSLTKQRGKLAHPMTQFTPQLESVALFCADLLQKDANKAHIMLLNLLFRSIGGSMDATIAADGSVDLEKMEDSERDAVITKVVHAMRISPNQTQSSDSTTTDNSHDYIYLLTTHPNSQQPTKIAMLAAREYRKIYIEFWYRLGRMILQGVSMMPNTAEDNDGDNNMDMQEDDDIRDDNDEKPSQSLDGRSMTVTFSPSRLDIETVRDLVMRFTEISTMGQPDLRGGVTFAILQLGLACAERSVEYEEKVSTVQRQYEAAVKSRASSTKAQALKTQMDSWKRIQLELEELVDGPILKAVFMHRYRDSNPHIRAYCLHMLQQIVLMRPDLFCRDKYLKYFGWMCSDAECVVRVAALRGILAPFEVHEMASKGIAKQGAHKDSVLNMPTAAAVASKILNQRPRSKVTILNVELERMQNVCHKFLPRIVECVNDVDDDVQEIAMTLMLRMLDREFLDDWDDDDGWNAINLKAVDPTATPTVRKNALYFIIDQLDAFDDIGEVDAGSSLASDGQIASQKKQVDRLEGIAQWLAHHLCAGKIPISKIRLDRVDFIVESMIGMEEHSYLVTSWPTLLRAIGNSENLTHGRQPSRDDIAKQRVLLRMLSTSSRLSCGEDETVRNRVNGIHPASRDAAEKQKQGRSKKKAKKTGSGSGQGGDEDPAEALSQALLASLPDLLVTFTGDVVALRTLTEIPRYLIPSIYAATVHKVEFLALVKAMCTLFAESTDEAVLENVALALSMFAQGSHERSSDVTVHLRGLSATLQQRLMRLVGDADPKQGKTTDIANNDDGGTQISTATSRSSKKRRGRHSGSSPTRKRRRRTRQSLASASDSESAGATSATLTTFDDGSNIDDHGDDGQPTLADKENSVQLCLLRVFIFTKNCPLHEVFAPTGDADVTAEEMLFNKVYAAIAKRLEQRQPILRRAGDDRTDEASLAQSTRASTIATGDMVGVENPIWKSEEYLEVHGMVAQSIGNGLRVLLNILAWTFREMFPNYGKKIEADKQSARANRGGSKENANEGSTNEGKDAEATDQTATGGKSGKDAGTQDQVDEEHDNSAADSVVRIRDKLIMLLCMSFDQCVDGLDEATRTEEHSAYLLEVVHHTRSVACDLRCLFPKEWFEFGKSKLLQALAIVDDSRLAAGVMGTMRLNDAMFEEVGKSKMNSKQDDRKAFGALAPVARNLAVNWTSVTRREAGGILKYLTSNGHVAHQVAHSVARVMKKNDVVRFLETQMASLRLGFDRWLDSEPDGVTSGVPTDEEVEQYEADIKEHTEMFHALELQASKLSSMLGVGKLSPKISQGLLGFAHEGIRFAFHGAKGRDDDLIIGSRLPFLRLVGKYSAWIKKDREGLSTIKRYLIENEEAMERDEEFDQVHPDDLKALAAFRASLGMKGKGIAAIVSKNVRGNDDDHSEPAETKDDAKDDPSEVGDDGDKGGLESDAESRSAGSSAKRARRQTRTPQHRPPRSSTMSTQSSLSPLEEITAEADETKTRTTSLSIDGRSGMDDVGGPKSAKELPGVGDDESTMMDVDER